MIPVNVTGPLVYDTATGVAHESTQAGRIALLHLQELYGRPKDQHAQTQNKFIEFLKALIKDADKKVFLILDNLRVHHSKPVKAWLAEHKEQIEAFYLPSYSPDLNPDERLNADLKYALGSRVQTRTKDKLKEATKAHMEMLQQHPERVRSYFDDPKFKYASGKP